MTLLLLAVAFLDVLLLWAVSRTPGWWAPKVAAIVVVLAFNGVVWHAGDSLTGWPRESAVPEGSKLISCQVAEPNAIYLWVIPANPKSRLGYSAAPETPRAYAVPYSRALHADCQASQKAQQQGLQLQVKTERKSSARGGQTAQRSSQDGGARLYVLPPSSPPPKG